MQVMSSPDSLNADAIDRLPNIGASEASNLCLSSACDRRSTSLDLAVAIGARANETVSLAMQLSVCRCNVPVRSRTGLEGYSRPWPTPWGHPLTYILRLDIGEGSDSLRRAGASRFVRVHGVNRVGSNEHTTAGPPTQFDLD